MESENVILDPHPELNQDHNLITSRWSLLAHAHHVWSTSANTFTSYPAHRQNDRRNNRKYTYASLCQV